MWQFFENLIRRLNALGHMRTIERALALNKRRDMRSDGLKLKKISSRVEIEWCARDIHPWDRHDPPERRARLFVRQCLNDTDAAITRLFETLPLVDVIAVRVLEPVSEEVIIAGTVRRSALKQDTVLSAGMRLWQRGVVYHSDGWRFEPLQAGDDRDRVPVETRSHVA
jgi:hypothetical protein